MLLKYYKYNQLIQDEFIDKNNNDDSNNNQDIRNNNNDNTINIYKKTNDNLDIFDKSKNISAKLEKLSEERWINKK